MNHHPPQRLVENKRNREKLFSWSFLGLLITQFTVALNDNIFRWLIVPIGKARLSVYFMEHNGLPMKEAYDKGAALALTLGGMVFLLPFILFSGYGGYCSDRFSKRTVMIWCKVAEIVIMAVGVLCIYIGNPWLLFIVLFAMGMQSAFYSPAKYSVIPEIVSEENIARANGYIGLTTMAAIILGTVVGGALYNITTLPDMEGVARGLKYMASHPGQYQLWISAAVLVGVAIFGLCSAFLIRKLQSADRERRFRFNSLGQSLCDLGCLWTQKTLLAAAMFSAFYWGLASLAQTNIDKFALPEIVGANGQPHVSTLLGVLSIGIGAGSFIAGFLSHGKVNLRPVPFAAMGVGISSLLLCLTPPGNGCVSSMAFYYAGITLCLLGVTAGMYDIPMLAYLQEQSKPSERGRVIAGSNFLSFSSMFLGSASFGIFAWLGLTPRGIWMVAGLATLCVATLLFRLVYSRFFSEQTSRFDHA
ncbi:MAG: MFS transporter [Planctomycetia bacterium]|nr:MFS transporter [Planctomycetia bacterium]